MAEDWFDLRGALPGVRGEVLHVLGAAREGEVEAVLQGAGFRVVALEGRRVRDEATLFAEMARACAWPAHFGRNWDALADALGDLGRGAERRVALLWRDAGECLTRDPQAAVSAFVALARAADDLASGEEPAQLETILLFGRMRTSPRDTPATKKRRSVVTGKPRRR
jgi:hypothetical protein